MLYIPVHLTSGWNNYTDEQQFKITKVNSTTGLNGPNMRLAILDPNTSIPGQTEISWKNKGHQGWITN